MDYALAKELKDAGFPQEINAGSFYFAGRNLTRPYCWGGEGEDKPYGEYWLHPTLEELISACGIEMVELTQINPTLWHVTSRAGKHVAKGNEPSVAVANLWLTLSRENAESVQ